jgi:tetratricopeptide (TPR) repeat protein
MTSKSTSSSSGTSPTDDQESQCRELLKTKRHEHGDVHADTIEAMLKLAKILKEKGTNIPETEGLYREALKSTKKLCTNGSHPDTLARMQDLAAFLASQGKLHEAAELYKEVLKRIKKTLLGKETENDEVIQVTVKLAIVLKDQRKLAEALPLFVKALKALKTTKRRGTHLDTLVVAHHLADVYRDIGSLDQAKNLYAETLAVMEPAFGRGHPATVELLMSIAELFRMQGKLGDEESVKRAELTATKSHYGASDLKSLRSTAGLANELFRKGKNSEAETCYRKALKGMRNTVGEDDTNTLQCKYELGLLLLNTGDCGKLDEAESLFREVVTSREGKELEPRTLICMNHLAKVLQRKKSNPGEVESWYKRAIDGMKKIAGEDNPDTLVFMTDLALFLVTTNEPEKMDKAVELLREVLAGQRRVLGVDHERTIYTLTTLLKLLAKMKKK